MMFIATQTASLPHPMVSGEVPELFMDANDDNRVSTRSDPPNLLITSLRNKSTGSLNNFFQPALDKQPRLQANGINGLGSIESRDTDDVLESVNTVSAAPVNFYLQFVWRMTAVPPSTIYAMSMNFGGGFQYFLVRTPATGKMQSRPFLGSSVGIIESIAAINADTTYIFTVIYDQPNSLHKFTINGVVQGTSSSLVSNNYSDRNNFLMNHVSVPISGASLGGTFLFHRRIPTDLTIARRTRYLANRYNVTV